MARGPKASLMLRLHKATGQAYVYADGSFHYFGRWGEPETEMAFRAWIADRTRQTMRDEWSESAKRPLSVGELAERFVAWMTRERGAGNSKTSHARSVALDLCREHAGLAVHEFGPRALQQVQRRLLLAGRHCRSGVNRRVRDIIGIYKWGVCEEVVRPEHWQALSTVRPLRRGEGRENPPRQAADSSAVDAVVRHFEAHGATGAALCVRFLRATGCRPSEAFTATPADLRLSESPPLYIPRRHKCDHHGMERIVPLNPAAEAAVREALASCPRTDSPLFRNRAGEAWEKTTLAHMIERACKALGIHKWTPYQLRHLVATEAVNRTGSEAAAAALLGHSPTSKVVQRYSRNRLGLASEAARAVGA
jgi:integrase